MKAQSLSILMRLRHITSGINDARLIYVIVLAPRRTHYIRKERGTYVIAANVSCNTAFLHHDDSQKGKS